ncbi:MAG: O-antigen ligase family protein, partial [Candidatus Latescibacteria bacterium]|nr:O-antigen ligase family protein [Candidatus Latescibacterota bacterium]
MGESIKNIWGLTGEHLRQMMVWGFQALVLIVPLVFTSMIQEYSTPKVVVAEIMVIVLAIFWLLSMVLDGEVMIVDTPLYYTFLGLLATSFISLFLAYNIFQGLDVLFRQVCFFLIAILVFHSVQTPEQMERLIGTMVLTGGIVAVIGLLQHNGVYSFGAPWNLPVSTIGNVNFTAQYYNVVFPLAIAMLFVVRRLWAQVGVGAACFLMSCHLVVLGSRGGWLGASVALVLIAGIALLRHFQIGRRLVDVVITGVVIVGLGWPVLTGMVGSIRIGEDRNVNHLVNEYWDSMTRRVEDAIRLEDDSSLQRVGLWEDTVRLIFDRPLLGVGIGNYEFSIPRFMSRESLEVKQRREAAVGQELMAYNAHNEYLEVWAETGLLGALAFLILLLQVGGALVGLIRRYVQGQVGFLAVGLVAAVVATLSHSLFSTNLQQPASAVYFWLVVGLVWSLRLNVEWLSPLGLLAIEARKVAVLLMVVCGFVLMVSIFMGVRTLVGELYYRRGEVAFRQKAYVVAEGQWQAAISYSPTKYFRTYQALGTAFYNQ